MSCGFFLRVTSLGMFGLVIRLVRVIRGTMSSVRVAGVFLMKLPGPVRTFEFMTFAGHAQDRSRHQKQGKTFHRAAS